MSTIFTRRIGATMLSLATLSACHEAVGPASAPTFDSQRVSAGMSVVRAAASMPAVSALQQVARLGGTATPSSTLSTRSTATASASIAQAALDAEVFAVTVLSPTVLGKTLIYDATARRYAVSARSGAPANGVRIVLYTETASKEPIVSQEVGYADVTNEAPLALTTGAVRLTIVTGGVTRLSYGVRFTLPGATPQVNIDGFIADPSNRLEFTIAASALTSGAGAGSVNATLRVPSAGVEVLATYNAAATGSGSVDLVVSSGTDRIAVTVAMAAETVDATFTVNGAVLARASGAASAPTIVSAGGLALTADERDALGRIVSTASAITQMITDLAAPATSIVQFAASIGR